MSGFFEELRRRKVYRVAIAYVVASWALAQGLAQVLPVFDIPNSVVRVVIALMLTGFPVALVLAWIFDITPTGIERTLTAPMPGTSAHRRRNVIWLGIGGIAISAAVGFFVLPRAVAHKIDKSIAVLPFENFSDDKENAFFADGIQDDVLTNLSKLSDLKVISRTSVMQYKGKAKNVREIGKALGVSNILEGSVRRSGNKVRVNVQLIDAELDKHIWANDYDRDLTDVFAIQTELAHDIANQLQAKLSASEKEWMEHKPTENGEAYLAFVQAHNLIGEMEDLEKLNQAEQLYARAIDLDPKFALACARYSQLESWLLHSLGGPPGRKEKARSMAEQALQLEPDLAEAHLAMGFVYYYCDNNYDDALREFEIAQRGLPNEWEAFLAIGAIQRRQGKWKESTANLRKAADLNPSDSWPLQNLAFNYEMQRDFDEAIKIVDRGLELNPRALALWETKAKLALAAKGDFNVVEEIFAKCKSLPMTEDMKAKVASGRADVFLLERRYQEGLQIAEGLPDYQLEKVPGALAGKHYLISFARKALGDQNGSQTAFRKTRDLLETQLKETPDVASLHIQLAKVLAYLGEKQAALGEAERATALQPESRDAFEGPDITAGVAEVYCVVGESDRAIELLGGLLKRPSGVTIPILTLSPVWDPLRKEPQFEALLARQGEKIAGK